MARLFTTIVFFVIFNSLRSQAWAWAYTAQSTGSVLGSSICSDPVGNVVNCGTFSGPSAVFGAFTVSNSGSAKLYIVKRDVNGNVLWVGSSNNIANVSQPSVDTDKDGNIYCAGQFLSTTISFGTFTLTRTGNANCFLVKFDPAGNVLWATSSQAASVNPRHLTVDIQSNVYVVGDFNGSTATFGTYTLAGQNLQNVFLAKYDKNGNILWARGSLGTGYDNGYSVSTDGAGNSYITGFMQGPSTSFGAYTLTQTGNGQAFFVKYDTNGSEMWASSPAGPSSAYSQGFSTAADVQGNIFFTGTYGGFVSIGAFTLSYLNGIFLAKFDASGNVVWVSTPSDGGGSRGGSSVSTDGNSVFIAGNFSDTLKIGTYTLVPSSGATYPMFVARYDVNGNVTYAEAFSGGGEWFNHNYIDVDKFCDLNIAGDFRGNPSNLVMGTNTLSLTGSMSEFVAKCNFNCLLQNVNESELVNEGINLFPNPCSGLLNIQTGAEAGSNVLILFNAIGQNVFEKKLEGQTTVINVQEFPKGIYSYVLKKENATYSTGKIIIR
jgi:hypothetical protein